jgi:membrane glycosyltransferase
MDTIKGAREEAAESVALLPNKNDKKDADQSGEAAAQSAGFSRKSAARAKPTREAAGSVHTVASTSSSGKSGGKGKADKAQRRTEQDLAYDAKRAYLNMMPGYQKTQRVWWVLIIIGIVCTLLGWGVMRGINPESGNTDLSVITMALMVVAYVMVIGAFIYDIIKVRPMRKIADEQVAGMTKRRMQKTIEEYEAQKAAAKEAKGK